MEASGCSARVPKRDFYLSTKKNGKSVGVLRFIRSARATLQTLQARKSVGASTAKRSVQSGHFIMADIRCCKWCSRDVDIDKTRIQGTEALFLFFYFCSNRCLSEWIREDPNDRSKY